MNEKNRKSAIEEAYSYLSTRMRTAAEVESRLRDKGYSGEEISDAVRELTEMKYLDDYQYALRYFEYNREKRRGSARAARELAAKGVDAETVRNAREDYLYTEKVDEFADALEVAEKELALKAGNGLADEAEGSGVEFDDRLSSRIARKLDGKGFERGDIFRVLEELRRRYGD